jgi:hypothetical protein
MVKCQRPLDRLSNHATQVVLPQAFTAILAAAGRALYSKGLCRLQPFRPLLVRLEKLQPGLNLAAAAGVKQTLALSRKAYPVNLYGPCRGQERGGLVRHPSHRFDPFWP